MKYDYLIVGAGLFGAVFANEAKKRGKRCFVIEKRPHIGGNCYTENREGIIVHRYGAHIFHTSNRKIWDYVNSVEAFTPFINSPVANYKGKLYNLPFNMNTFYALWRIRSPKKAREKIASQIIYRDDPQNAEEQALSLVGRDIYEVFIKGYTEKQWGKSAKNLSPDIIKRLPLRFTFDNNYFNDTYQGIPENGYTSFIGKLLQGVEVKCNVDFFEKKDAFENMAEKVIYTGAIDEYYGYCFGKLEYRSLNFDLERLEVENFQGCAVMNYTERQIPYTRIIEHKHFGRGKELPFTYITHEYPQAWRDGAERFYPVADANNRIRSEKYKMLSQKQNKVIFGGRLGQYRYYDMDDVIEAALLLSNELI